MFKFDRNVYIYLILIVKMFKSLLIYLASCCWAKLISGSINQYCTVGKKYVGCTFLSI